MRWMKRTTVWETVGGIARGVCVTAVVALVLCVGSIQAQSSHPHPHSQSQPQPEPTDAGGDLAEFVVRDRVVLSDAPRFGANVLYPVRTHWGGWVPRNQWIQDPSFEPALMRYQGFADGGSATALRVDANRHGWPSVFAGDMLAGAEARVYRQSLTGGVWLLRSGRVASSRRDARDGDVLVFGEEGPAVREGDFFQLTTTLAGDDVPAVAGSDRHLIDSVIPSRAAASGGVRLRIDRSSHAPQGGGVSSLRVEVGDMDEPGGYGHWWLSNLQGDRFTWTPALGKELFGSLWLRGEGVDAVTLQIGAWTQRFEVGEHWQLYTYRYPSMQPRRLGRIALTAQGPGTFWVDEWSMHDPALAVEAMRPEYVKALKAYRPGHLRFWAGVNQRGGGNTLDNYLAAWPRRMAGFDVRHGRWAPQPTTLHADLSLALEVGAEPWIIASPTWTPEEHRHLLEYLAGSTDTPYGALRASHGRAEPWSAAFDEIIVEIGNEQWNRIFMPLAFGLKGRFYGGFCDYLIGEARASEHFAASKVRYMVGGQAVNPGFNKAVAWSAKRADGQAIATYSGGGFDAEDIVAHGSEETYRQRLYYVPRIVRRWIDENHLPFTKRARLRPAVYEGGMGYDLPKPGEGYDAKAEAVGKSIAQAMTTLDTFLYAQSRGYGAQCYFAFRPGPNWASHSPISTGFHPHAAWLALQMRNRYCSGDMIEVEAVRVPRVDLPESVTERRKWNGQAERETLAGMTDVPTVMAYAYRDGDAWSIIAYSRRLDGTTPTRFVLPLDAEKMGDRRAQRYLLSAEAPWANNIEEEAVRVVEDRVSVVPAAGGGGRSVIEASLPPFSVMVLRVWAGGVVEAGDAEGSEPTR